MSVESRVCFLVWLIFTATPSANFAFSQDSLSTNNPDLRNTFQTFNSRYSEPPKNPEYLLNPDLEKEDKWRTWLISHIADRIVWDHCSKKARNEAAWIIWEMMREMPPMIVAMTVALRAKVVIVPKGTKVIDFPQAQTLLTFNRNVQIDAEGMTGEFPDGSFGAFVPEEDLLTYRDWGGLRATSREIFVHEWAHMIHKAMIGTEFDPVTTVTMNGKKEVKDHIQELFDKMAPDMRKSWYTWFNGTFDGRTTSNSADFFADMTTAWFSVFHKDAGAPDAGWIRDNYRELFDFMKKVYGPPRPIKAVPDDA